LNVNLRRYTTEEAAVQAYNNYAKDGFDTVKRREGTSKFKGVCWAKANGKWTAKCKGQYLGYHATEEAAAQACDNYAKVGWCRLTASKPVLKAPMVSALEATI